MRIDLHNRTALVTGSSAGIGRTIALAFARAGAQVIVCGRNKKTLTKTEREIRALSPKSKAYQVDGTKPDQVKKTMTKIKVLDILVNNIGGVTTFGDFFTLCDKDWKDALDLNFLSMMYFSREAVPLLKKSSRARIINICTIPARQPGNFNPHYSAAKAAMLNLSKYLSNCLAQDNILVNSILPGTIQGEDLEKRIRDRARRDRSTVAAARAKITKENKGKNPLGKLGEPDDIASLALFLASDKAKFMTGTSIGLDGGATRSIF